MSKLKGTPRKKQTEKDRITVAMYKAVQRYVEAYGGSVVVVGGVSIAQGLSDRALNYSVAIHCTGEVPAYAR
jgi:hypothetical protein